VVGGRQPVPAARWLGARRFASDAALRIQCRFAKWLDLNGFRSGMSTEREPDPGLDVDEALAAGSSLSTWIVLGTALLLVGGLGFFALADRVPEATTETELRELAASFKTVYGNFKVKTAGEVRLGDAETSAALR
jgi:hypothetical protein